MRTFLFSFLSVFVVVVASFRYKLYFRLDQIIHINSNLKLISICLCINSKVFSQVLIADNSFEDSVLNRRLRLGYLCQTQLIVTLCMTKQKQIFSLKSER